MTINMISERTELAHRVSGGIDVYLFWNEHTSRVTVGVLDTRGDESFEFEVDRGKRSTPSTIPTPTTHGGPTMHVRIDSPALTVPGALKPLQEIGNAAKQADIAETTLYLVELRASQINSCGVCVDIHSRELRHSGEPDERINTVAVWRDVSYFTEAERAALALTEAATRLADRPDPFRTTCGKRRAPLRRDAARRARARDRRDQRLESPQRQHEADQRRLGGSVGRLQPEGQRGSLTQAGSTAQLSRLTSGAGARRSSSCSSRLPGCGPPTAA